MIGHARRTSLVPVTLLALTALFGACVDRDPRGDPDGDPDNTPPATVPATPPTPGPTAIGSAHVTLTVATANTVTVDVTDASATLLRATSGAPGDGATVEPYTLLVTNLSPTTLRLTWVGGPCDLATTLSIDAARKRLLLVQPECSGDAIATDRILDLEFSTPVRASDLAVSLQDGLDT